MAKIYKGRYSGPPNTLTGAEGAGCGCLALLAFGFFILMVLL